MTFEDFLKKVWENWPEGAAGWLTQSFLLPETHRQPSRRGLTERVTWSGGGTSGSCYNDEKSIIYPEPEPELSDIDTILEIVAPNLSFLQYKNITRKVVKRGETSFGDYYGGSSTEYWKGFNIEDLYNELDERGLI